MVREAREFGEILPLDLEGLANAADKLLKATNGMYDVNPPPGYDSTLVMREELGKLSGQWRESNGATIPPRAHILDGAIGAKRYVGLVAVRERRYTPRRQRFPALEGETPCRAITGSRAVLGLPFCPEGSSSR